MIEKLDKIISQLLDRMAVGRYAGSDVNQLTAMVDARRNLIGQQQVSAGPVAEVH